MPKFAGIVTSLNEVDLVVLEENAGSFAVRSSLALKTQIGDRARAYDILYKQLADLLKNSGAEGVWVKGDAFPPNATKNAHNESAELRGVVLAAAASASVVHVVGSNAGQAFGGRTLQESVGDDAFWQKLGLSGLKREMREAAFAVIGELA